MPTFAVPFLLHLKFRVYPPLEAAGSAPMSNCSRQGLCTSISAAFKISVFTNSMVSYSVIKVFLDMFYSRAGSHVQKEGTLKADSNSRQSFPTPPNFYEHLHNGISNTWATTAVTVDASYIIICFLFKKQQCCFIYCRQLPSHGSIVPGNSKTFVTAAGGLALSDTVFIIAVITGAALSPFCRSLHCLEILHVRYWHDCWSFRAFLGGFGTLGCVFLGG